MAFRMPDCIRNAIEGYLSTGVLCYYEPRASYKKAFIGWKQRYHGCAIKEESLRFSPGVVSAINWFINMLTNPGDAIIVLTPVYYHFHNAVKKNGRGLLCSDLINRGGLYSIDLEILKEKYPKTA